MPNQKRKKNAFTLAETLIVASLFAIMVLGIIFGINRAFSFMNNTRVLVRATNFAREGVEMVYNLRDTNRRKCSGNRDKTRLYVGGSEECNGISPSEMLRQGIYTIKEGKRGDDSYIYAEYLTGNSEYFYDIDGFFDSSNSSDRDKSRITFSGEYSYYSGGTIATGNMKDLLEGSGIEFYRILRVFGIYCKNSDDPDDYTSCPEDTDPKELRFCVKVFYTYNGGLHSNELCSIMTNFME